jgi:hypothetical protein
VGWNGQGRRVQSSGLLGRHFPKTRLKDNFPFSVPYLLAK